MDSVTNVLEVSQDETKKLDAKLDIATVSACERKIVITIPPEEISRYFDKEFDEIVENANVPGFRKGRAPRKLVEKQYKKMVRDRVKNALILDSVSLLQDNDSLTPISEPDFDFDAVVLPDEERPMVFEFTLEVRPEFDLPEWKGLKIEKPVAEFTSDDVNHAMERVLSDHGTLEPIEEAASAGDYILAKLTFLANGEVISSAEQERIRIRPTLSFHDGVIKDFDQFMKGVKAGEIRETTVTLSEDAANVTLRGKDVTAKFEVKEVLRLELPELTSEFLHHFGVNDVGELKDEIKTYLQRQLEFEQRRRTRQQVTELLTVSASWTLPPALLERQAYRELQRMIMELQRSGYSDNEIRSQINYLRQNSRTATAQALKEHFILEKIAEIEGIETTEVDYDAEIRLIAVQQNETPRRVRARLEKQGQMDILRNQIVERKVLDLIFENAVFTEVPYEMPGITDEAVDHAAGGGDEAVINEATEEDLHAANREAIEKKELNIEE
ncbi:MAG: trigger factor [Planctomycetaceae bacterium]|jgi:trigger factor|nr:trigger factor [Planctomycetaceae bacterium]